MYLRNKFNLGLKSVQLRQQIFTSIYTGNGGHLGGCFSIIDFLVVVYYKFLNFNTAEPYKLDRDKLILSKGHCSLALYWILSDVGFFDKDLIASYGEDGSHFAGHPELGKAPGIEASTGSLGHGPSIGVGAAISSKKYNFKNKILVICGDGELNEGSVWEAIMCASQHRLNNFYLIIDNNKLESLDLTNNIISIEPIHARLEAFGFKVIRVDGHSHSDIENGLLSLQADEVERPKCLVLDTNKGHGLSFTHLVPQWHFRSPTADEYERGLLELVSQERKYEK